jgi:hypothetical protein
VYVALEAAPWIWRAGTDSAPALVAHTGASVHRLDGAWLDEQGRLFLATELGFGLLDSTDAAAAERALVVDDGAPARAAALDALCRGDRAAVTLRGAALGLDGNAQLEPLRFADAAHRFRFDPTPSAD